MAISRELQNPTLLHRLAAWAKESPEAPAQKFKSAGKWETITAKEFNHRVYYFALFLEGRGFTSKDIGAIFSVNCPEWVHVDLGTVLFGARSAGIYPNASPKDIHYILNQTRAALLSVQNREFFEKIAEVPASVRLILVFDGDTSIHPKAISYEDAIEEGRKRARSARKTKLSDFLGRIDPNEGLFMIYTSGTTGNPKGALLSLDNFTFTADIAARYWRLPYGHGTLCSFLPLCHVAEKIQNIGVGVSQRYTVSFCSKIENVSRELPEVEPTLLLSVPRLWEKMMEGVQHRVESSEGVRKKMALWALEVGARVAEARYSGKLPNAVDLVQYQIADRLVLSKIRKAMGLGRVEKLAAGAAALPSHVTRWFRRLGLEILEDYGQTESTGVICMTEPGLDCAGTVGRAVPGVEVKLAEDGEILTRGRHVFKGYFNDPESTEQVLAGGWLHTGDLGELTANGLIKIRGRKKEVLKTSGGKMIAPLPIEDRLKETPGVSQVCVVGDGRKFLSVLLTLTDAKLEELRGRGVNLSGRIIEDTSTLEQMKESIDRLNSSLAGFEQLKRFTILSHEFSVTDGEMTPTLKMKRNVIETRYRDVIDEMYGAHESV